MGGKRRHKRESKKIGAQRAASEFIKLLRDLGVTLRRCEDGTIEVFSAKPLPPVVALFLANNVEEIGEALAKERPGALPYSHDSLCPDCQQPFTLVAFDAGDKGKDARLWRCGCHTLLGQEL